MSTISILSSVSRQPLDWANAAQGAARARALGTVRGEERARARAQPEGAQKVAHSEIVEERRA